MKWTRTQRWAPSRSTSVLFAVVFFILGALVVAAIMFFGRNVNPLPSTIQRQIHFPALIPSAYASVNARSYKYSAGEGVLTFTARLTDGQVVTFAEQATPDPINDIPGYYDKFLQTLNEYHAFDSLLGTVHLTHPKNAGQAAVMNTKGTLLFARVAHDEPDTTWQQLFGNLTLYKP